MKVRSGGRRIAAACAASAALVLVNACGGPKHDATPPTSKPTSSVPATTTTSPTTTTTARHAPECPLTGEPPPKGRVPQRAALAVKVENLPEARPQWGLNTADIVFEEPVEGGITRFIAVYQCGAAGRIEPVRSGRFVDVDILEPLGKILFAYSGAIQPVVDQIDSRGSLLQDVGADKAGGAYYRDPDRLEPHNLATSTPALYSAAATFGYSDKPPPPMFAYGQLPGGGRTVGAVNIDFPLDVTSWTWDVKTKRWLRSYSDTGPAIQGDNVPPVQISAVNVVIMHVHEYATAYVEDPTGALENQLVLTGSGPAWVFRNGVELTGTWRRPSLKQPAVFEEKNGTTITLKPGNTWEELLPWERKISVLPRPVTAHPAVSAPHS